MVYIVVVEYFKVSVAVFFVVVLFLICVFFVAVLIHVVLYFAPYINLSFVLEYNFCVGRFDKNCMWEDIFYYILYYTFNVILSVTIE